MGSIRSPRNIIVENTDEEESMFDQEEQDQDDENEEDEEQDQELNERDRA